MNFVGPDGRDWIKNMETWRYGWRDDISANSDDILNDLNINKEYSMRSENLFYVAGEKESYDKNNIQVIIPWVEYLKV